jgi:hypothetical protein
MISSTFARRTHLQDASRLPVLSSDARVTAADLVLLLACGALATIAVGGLHLQLSIPGHAILRGVIPMALGLALVPRRGAGRVMSVGAGLTAIAMIAGQFGRFQPAALLSVLLLGPVLDVVLAGRPTGWRLYARFVAAGIVANAAAFIVRLSAALVGWQLSGGRQVTAFWQSALVSFVVCGAIAGLVSAALWFRLSPSGYRSDDLRRP